MFIVNERPNKLNNNLKNNIMKRINIYTDRIATIKAAAYINKNRNSCYIGFKNNTNFYNICGVVWEWWHEGLGGYPTSNNQKIEKFTI